MFWAANTLKGVTIGAQAKPNAMLDVRGSGIFTGGLNVGTVTGAGVGSIYGSGLFYSKVDGAGGGFWAGTAADVELYRGGSGLWRTPNSLTIDGGLTVGPVSGAAAGQIRTSSDIIVGATVSVNGAIVTGAYFWSNSNAGSAAGMFFGTTGDAQLYRSAAAVLRTTGGLTVGSGFGANGAAPQTAFASGGALTVYGAGANGFVTAGQASALYALVVAMRAALVADGIMS
jgi:hypothetical protein